MRKIIALILFVAFGILPLQILACGQNKVHSIKMERTPCMGMCPWYTIEIQEDGSVKYWGKKDAPRQGYFEGKIDADVAKKMMRKFSKKKMLKAQNEYHANIVDLPMIHYTFGIGKDRAIKKVRQANFGPAYFVELGKEVDEALANVKWTRASDSENE